MSLGNSGRSSGSPGDESIFGRLALRRLSLIIALGLLVVGLLISIGTRPSLEEVLKDIGIAALVAGTIGILDFVLIRREFQGVTETAVEKVFEKEQRFHRAGLQKIHERLPHVLLTNRFNTAATIRILQTWTGIEDHIRREIEKAARREGCEAVKVLLLDPYSDQVRFRARALGAQRGRSVSPEFARENIMEDLQALCGLNKVKVRVYDAAPIIAMFEFDSIKLIGIYWTGRYTIEGPQLEMVSSETAYLTREVNELFKALWGEEDDARNLTLGEFERWNAKNDELENHGEQPLTLENYRAALESN